MKKVDSVSFETVKNGNLNNKKGITLIALIITIIVLLILAGVSIATITGENGLLERARIAKETTDNVTNEEQEKIAGYENEIDNYVNGTRDTVTLTTEQYNNIMSRLEKLENNTIKFADYNTELASITTSGTSYTATEDCVAVCGMQIKDVTAGAIVYVDGLAVTSTYVYASNMSENYTSTMVYVKKGSTISTREYGIYNIKIYAMQK